LIQNRDEGLVSPSDIADLVGVSRGAVSNWRKRTKTFPEPVAGTPSKPLFSLKEVTDWLERHASKTKNEALLPKDRDGGDMDVWAALNLLRERLSVDDAADLVLTLAIAHKNGEAAEIDMPNVDPETLARVSAAIDRVDIEELGTAVDFTLERLARSQGKVGADFGFVGSRTTTLLANLAATLNGGVLYDPACGIGAAVLEAVKLGARPVRVVGHDINQRALRIAAQRAELHEVDLELLRTDVLADDIDPTLRADAIVLEPPFGVRLDASARLTDARFDFGPPPRFSADTAWLQHTIAHLTGKGRAYVLSPAGTLFRGGEEGKIRTELVRHGCVEAVVGLPGKLLPHTSIPLALWALRRPVTTAATEQILLIDASETVSPEHFVRAWLTDRDARDNVPHVEVPITDILAAESVLTPRRWVDRTEREPREITECYREGWAAINETMKKLQDVLSSFEHFASFSKSRVMTVGELVDQGVLELRSGHPKDRYENLPEELRERIATASDVRDGTLNEIGVDTEYETYPELTWEGDVLVTTMNTIRARVDEAGGHFPATGVYRLRVRDREVFSPAYLAIALTGSWNERFQGGSTIQRASIKDLEVPLVPRSEQQNLQLAVLSIQLLHEQATHLAEEAGTVATALFDAVRYNAPLANSAISAGQAGQDGPKDSGGAK
jgi:SAM-dependent methyltransferase